MFLATRSAPQEKSARRLKHNCAGPSWLTRRFGGRLLAEQRRGDAAPFLVETAVRDGLSGAPIPIGGVAPIALLAMQIGVHPIANAALVVLRRRVRAVPVAPA